MKDEHLVALRELIAARLGWTLAECSQISLLSLRDVLRATCLCREVSELIRSGEYLYTVVEASADTLEFCDELNNRFQERKF